MRWRLLALLLPTVALWTGLLGPAAHAARPGGAPPPGSGPVDVTGFIRVIEADTVEIRIEGRQVGVGFVGIEAPMGNTACGRRAIDRLVNLLARGLRLEEDEDLSLTFDVRRRRMYHAVSKADGSSLAAQLVRAGFARSSGRGRERPVLEALENEARAARRGCLWGTD
jgi:endonuclease YncB( thermonuclease family)